MAFLRLINIQGWAGIGVSVILASMLGLTAYREDQWHSSSVAFESQFHAEQAAHRQTIINYQNAAETARRQDAANMARVQAQQAAINERTKTDYEARLASARAEYARLVRTYAGATSHSGSSPAADVPGPIGAPGGPHGATAEDGLSLPDRLLATEQAIQLDELIKWVRANTGIDYSGEHK